MVEVHPDDTLVAAALQTGPGVPGSVVEPGRVRWPRATRDDVPHLVHALTGAGVRVFGVGRREPSLEDVYLALHETRVDEDVSG